MSPSTSPSKPSADRNLKFVWLDGIVGSRLSPATIVVGVAMSNRANGVGEEFYASVDDLTKLTGLARRTVERARTRLREVGWLRLTRRGGRSGETTWASRFVLTFPPSQTVNSDGGRQEANSSQTVNSDGGKDGPNPPIGAPNPSLLTHQPATGDGGVDQCLDQQLVDQAETAPAEGEEDDEILSWMTSPETQAELDRRNGVTDLGPRAELTKQQRQQRDADKRRNQEEGLNELGDGPVQKPPRSRPQSRAR